MKTIPLEELMTYMFLESCVDKLERDNASSASKNEKINKLKAKREKFMEDKINMFLEDEA